MNKNIAIKQLIVQARNRLVQLHFENEMAHIGGSLSCVDFLVILFNTLIKEEDDFILSKGHSASALYVCLRVNGIINEQVLQTYAQDGSLLGVHPISNEMMRIPFGTGSLGHGLSLAAGMTLGKKMLKKEGRVYCLCSDGETQEGSFWEGIIFSSHHHLSNLTLIIDVNGWQGFGKTEDVASQGLYDLNGRLASFGWDVDECDGHDINDILRVLSDNKLRNDERARAILLRTCKGKGVPSIEDQLLSHYVIPNEIEYREAMCEAENII